MACNSDRDCKLNIKCDIRLNFLHYFKSGPYTKANMTEKKLINYYKSFLNS